MSSNKTKQHKRQKRRDAVGFDLHPPCCHNCKNHQPALVGIPGIKQFIPGHCIPGAFAVRPWSICDCWESESGETLEVV